MKPTALAQGKFDRAKLFHTAAQIVVAGDTPVLKTTPPVSEKIFADVRREAAPSIRAGRRPRVAATPSAIPLETVRLAIWVRSLEQRTSARAG